MKLLQTTGKALLIPVFISLVLTGCAGRTPNPVAVFQPDDQYLTCRQISNEIYNNQQEMHRLYPKTKKTGKNVALGAAGAFLIVPWFFMDFSDAEKVEIEAFQRRDAHLHQLAERKGCNAKKLPPKIKFNYEKRMQRQ